VAVRSRSWLFRLTWVAVGHAGHNPRGLSPNWRCIARYHDFPAAAKPAQLTCGRVGRLPRATVGAD
jgi:hypothetical protein